MFHNRPVLNVAYAWALLDIGELEEAEIRLGNAERLMVTMSDMTKKSEPIQNKIIVVDQEQFRSLPASIATARGYISQSLGDIKNTEKYARKALSLAHEDDHYQHDIATALLGLALWANGNLEEAK